MVETSSQRVWQVTMLFLKLGLTAFGGPAAYIAMMRDEVVQRRRWITEEHFLDMLGATNLIPGPNATEMAIHIGFVRAGWPGLITAGAAFSLPGVLIVLALASIYTRYGTAPSAGWLLYGVKPVVIAIIIKALIGLGQKAIKNWTLMLIGLGVFVLYFFNLNEIGLLFAGGTAGMLAGNIHRLREARKPNSLAALPIAAIPALAAAPFSLPLMFLTFLKTGAVLYGSGYVLLAFLRSDFVLRLGWLTDKQLMDAIAIGQVTPGPLFNSAAFIGYYLGGIPGGLLAALGIFLPSFIYVALSNPVIPRVRSSPWAGALLDGVNAASLGLMAAVTLQLGRDALADLPAILAAGLAALALFRFKVNPTWLVLAGAAFGLFWFWIH
jgi:chromate transporter